MEKSNKRALINTLSVILSTTVATLAGGCSTDGVMDGGSKTDGGADVGQPDGGFVCMAAGDAGIQKVIQVDGVDGCLQYRLTSESDVVTIGSDDVSFVMTVTNACVDPYTIHYSKTPPGGLCITTNGTTCTMNNQRGIHGNQYVAILPRDGWSQVVFDLVIQKDESYSLILPWNAAADNMVNHDPAPPCFYDVYGFLATDTIAFAKHLTIEVR